MSRFSIHSPPDTLIREFDAGDCLPVLGMMSTTGQDHAEVRKNGAYLFSISKTSAGAWHIFQRALSAAGSPEAAPGGSRHDRGAPGRTAPIARNRTDRS